MVIELLPSTRDNLLRLALLEREDDGKKIFFYPKVAFIPAGLTHALGNDRH